MIEQRNRGQTWDEVAQHASSVYRREYTADAVRKIYERAANDRGEG